MGTDPVVDFPTLGDLADAWIEHHCRVPALALRGAPFRQYDWQFWCTANHYRVREDAVDVEGVQLFNQAFVYRRSLIVAPQKTGKGPMEATWTALEAAGPCLFDGWAKAGEVYRCDEHGCSCGWYFEYESGEPKGTRHPSPLVQMTATSQDQVDNSYGALVAMIHLGPLKDLLLPRESFIRVKGASGLPDMDKIEAATSAALSRLGNPVSFVPQDETGTWTTQNKMRKVAETQRRGAAGMGGRSAEFTNCWDPSEASVAQSTWESTAEDVFKFWRNPDLELRRPDGKPLSFRDKRERRAILEFVYSGSDHVNLDSIEAEAVELMYSDPAQAERFFGNRLVAGSGAWLPDGVWDANVAPFAA